VLLLAIAAATWHSPGPRVGAQSGRRPSTTLPSTPAAPIPQDNSWEEMLAEWENFNRENVSRVVAFRILEKYLPAGAKVTSGYRSAQDQLNLIRKFAQRYNAAHHYDQIPLPARMEINNEASWDAPLRELRARGFIINAPTATPHSSDDAVFDLAGADLQQIIAGCRAAERAGKIRFRNPPLPEPKNRAVHLDVAWIAPDAFNQYGSGPAAAPGESPEDARKRTDLSRLDSLLDKEGDPKKRIDYLNSKIALWDPLKNPDEIRRLRDEIVRENEQIEKYKEREDKRKAIEEMAAAARQENYEEASRLVAINEQRFPDDPQVAPRIKLAKTAIFVEQAVGILSRNDEGKYDQAEQMIGEALALTPGHPQASNLKAELEARRQAVRGRLIAILVFVLLVIAAIAVLLYRWKRQPTGEGGEWTLEVIDGPADEVGRVHHLADRETWIGSREDKADIVISDERGFISGAHCLIGQAERGIYVKDQSRNGTRVNGKWLDDDENVRWLREGDQIALADVAVLQVRRR
jgi:tetratricopeptide (TPR) repeat protein